MEIAILCWVKFYTLSQTAAWVATGLLIPIMFIFVLFAGHFYLKLVAHKSDVMKENIRELEMMHQRLDKEAEGPNGSVQHV